METRRRKFSSAIFWLGLGVVLFAVGAKLALIHRYGTDQPYADQWTAEGLYMVRGPLYYHIDWLQYFSPHGEHRPALSRLWLRGMVAANDGQWDCFVELVANLLIYALFLTIMWKWVARLLDGRALVIIALFMAALFAIPCSYENFLWGFQSCFLFMLLTGMVHLAWTMESDRPDGRWWLAQLAGLAGLFSIAAGVMSAAALVVMAGLELLRGRRKAWAWSTLAANAVLLALGLWLLNETEPPAGSLLTRLCAAVVRTGYLLSWPFAGAWWSLLFQAPSLSLLLSYLRGRENQAEADKDRRVVAAGLWMVGSAFAIAYGRTFTSETIGGRYYDILIAGLFFNILALLRIQSRLTRWRRVIWGAGGALWLALLLAGLWSHNKPDNLGQLFKFMRDQAVEQRQVVRDFLVSTDPTRLQEFNQETHRFPHMEYTLVFLRDPKVPAILPPSLTPDGHANILSRWAVRIAAGWPVVLGAGVLLLLGGTIRLRRKGLTEPGA